MGRRNAKYDTRNVFIIGPDGKIASRMMKFNVLAGDAYTELAKDVAATLKPEGRRRSALASNWYSRASRRRAPIENWY